MTWAKLDDGFPDSPKVERLGDAAFRVHVRAICHSARMLTDGFVLVSTAERWGKRSVSECIRRRVWHRGDDLCEACQAQLIEHGHEAPFGDSDAIYVHNFLEYNRSRAVVNAERTASRTRKERWIERARNGVPNGERTIAPTRPDVPTEHFAHARARAVGRVENQAPARQPPRFTGRCDECGFAVGHGETCSQAGRE